MTGTRRKVFKHVCPKNCFSSCTMFSVVENGRIAELKGDSAHPYTNGKLCAKGFALMEMNRHPERLKYPYYQEVKGSGKFIKISWEKAYDLIISEMVHIYRRNNHFLRLGFYAGTGNMGVQHQVTGHFFAGLPRAAKIVDLSSTVLALGHMPAGQRESPRPMDLKEAALIVIWGANPAATNVHLIPFLIEARVKGAKIVVIDPLYTQTAEMADLYVQLRPGSDAKLACLLLKGLLESDHFLKKRPDDRVDPSSEHFAEIARSMDAAALLRSTDVSEEAVELLRQWLEEKGPAAHVIGNGVLRQAGAEKSLRAITALADIRGDFGADGGGIYTRRGPANIFHNPQFMDGFPCEGRILQAGRPEEIVPEPSLDMLWISGANPLTQSLHRRTWETLLQEAGFTVVVDHFLTPTAKWANLVLPATTFFEETDIVVNDFHQGLAFNEPAVAPYYESRSEWRIFTDLAERLERALPGVLRFPICSSAEEHLDSLFNEAVFQKYGVKNLSQLKERPGPVFPIENGERDGGKCFLKQLSGTRDGERGEEGDGNAGPPLKKRPPEEHPFWLLTPHHPYRLNSQFHFLHLHDEKETFAAIHEQAARRLGIFDGEIIRLANDCGSVEVKAVYSTHVPEDTLFMYEGWNPGSEVEINKLFPPPAQTGGNPAGCLHTFVKAEKL